MQVSELIDLIATELPKAPIREYAQELAAYLDHDTATADDAARLLVMAAIGASESQSALFRAIAASNMKCVDVVVSDDETLEPLDDADLSQDARSVLAKPFASVLASFIRMDDVRVDAVTVCRGRIYGIIEISFEAESGRRVSATLIFTKGEKSAFESGGPPRGSFLGIDGMDISATIGGEVIDKITRAVDPLSVRNAKNIDELRAAWPVALGSRQIGR